MENLIQNPALEFAKKHGQDKNKITLGVIRQFIFESFLDENKKFTPLVFQSREDLENFITYKIQVIDKAFSLLHNYGDNQFAPYPLWGEIYAAVALGYCEDRDYCPYDEVKTLVANAHELGLSSAAGLSAVGNRTKAVYYTWLLNNMSHDLLILQDNECRPEDFEDVKNEFLEIYQPSLANIPRNTAFEKRIHATGAQLTTSLDMEKKPVTENNDVIYIFSS